MRLIDILRKDLRIILSDRKALVTMIVMPVVLSTILSFALSGAFMSDSSDNTAKFDIVIVKKYNLDAELNKVNESFTSGILSQYIDIEENDNLLEDIKELNIEEIFFDKFLDNDELKKIIKYRVEDEDTAMELLENKKTAAIVVLPEDFIYSMTINFITPFRNVINIKVIGNPEYNMGAQIVEGIMAGFSDMTSSMIIGKNVFLETAFEEEIEEKVFEDIDTIIEEMTNNTENLGVNIDYVKLKGKKPVSSFQYYAAAMATMFILFAAGYGSRTLLEEKDNITYQRMIIAGTSKLKIAAGKFFMIFLLSLLQITIMVIYSSIVLKVSWGNVITVSVISLCTMFSVAGLGTMIAAATFKAGNYKMATVFDNVIIQVMALIGGSFIPFEILPKFMQKLSILSINGVALKSFLKAMMGYGIGEIKVYLLVLLGTGIVFTSIGVFILRWKEGLSHA